jgi:hypothetical protein
MNRIAFCTLGLLWSAACGSDRPTGSGPEDWLFSATISGSPDLVDHSGTAYVQDGHLLSIIGGGTIGINRRAIEVKAAGVSGTGSFNVTVGGNRASYGETGPNGQYWVANFEQGSGTLTVTEYSQTRVVASFSFTAYTDATLTNQKSITGTCVCRVQLLAAGTR